MTESINLKLQTQKIEKNRKITMPLILEKMLRELYKYYHQFEGFNEEWFVFGGHRHLPSTSIDREKDNAFDLVPKIYGININRITNHEFRHSHATYLYSRGVKLSIIAYRLIWYPIGT